MLVWRVGIAKETEMNVRSDEGCADRCICREASELGLKAFPGTLVLKGVRFRRADIFVNGGGETTHATYLSVPNRNVKLTVVND